MAGLEDAVLPILRNIQAEIADLRRESKEMREDIRKLSERFDSFEDFFTYMMGMTERNKLDIHRLGRDMRILKDRMDQLEPQT